MGVQWGEGGAGVGWVGGERWAVRVRVRGGGGGKG